MRFLASFCKNYSYFGLMMMAIDAAGKKQKVRLFVGYEYETHSGRRFIAFNSTEQVRLNKKTGFVFGSARSVMTTNMPLCMQPNDVKDMATIIRIHVVVPNEKIQIRVQPKVKFWNKIITTDPVLLPPNGVYVIQFPKVFVWEDKPIKLPTTEEGLKGCILMAKAVEVIA
eukprot:m.44090 g.44090  ORF g.44090 m.44090 type:complete len:170 (+) comp7146_c0_seq2:2509-3018(+)